MVLRVVSGVGTGPTALAAYDAALLAAGVGNYNLIELSSVIPTGAAIERAGTAPDLGPVGAGLHVVEASATAGPGEVAGAALGWVRREDGSGLFYEEGEAVSADAEIAVVGTETTVADASTAADDAGTAADDEGDEVAPELTRADAPATTGTGTDDRLAHEQAVAERVRTGVAAGVEARGWDASEPVVVTAGAEAGDGGGDRAGDRDGGDAAHDGDGSHDGDSGSHASAVVIATYGRARALDDETPTGDGP